MPAPYEIRVALIDDHELIREGLRRAFEREPDVQVVAEAATVQSGLAIIESQSPDVAVIDLRLPDGDGITLVRESRRRHPQLGIVVLTMYAGDQHLFDALEAGASAFIPKSAPADEIVAAARHAAATPRTFSSPDLASAMQRRMNDEGPHLSPRERQVLDLLAAFVQLLDLTGQRGGARLQKLRLAVHQKSGIRIFRRCGHQNGIEYRLRAIVALCLVPPATGHKLEQLPLDDGQFRDQCGLIQPDQNLILGDMHPLGHQNFRHHTAIGVLHDLPVLIDLNPAVRHNGARDIGQRRPCAETAQQHDQPRNPDHHRAADREIPAHRTPPIWPWSAPPRTS